MRKKIIILLTAIFSFFTIGVFLSFFNITRSTKELNKIIKLQKVEQRRQTLLINLQSVQNILYTVRNTPSGNLDIIVESMEHLDESGKSCSTCHHPPGIMKEINKIQTMINDYQNHLSFYITIRANEKRMLQLKEKSAEIGKMLIRKMEKISHTANINIENLTIKSKKNIENIINILSITLFLTLLFAVLFAVKLITSITTPINKLLNLTRIISSGSLGVTINQKFKTEFGELADNFNTMSLGLKKSYDELNREISERKQAEDMLRKSEERYALAARGANDGLWDWDLKTDTIFYSPRWKSMLGYGEDEIKNTPDEWLKRIHPDDRLNIENELFVKKNELPEQFQKEYRIMHKDGAYRWVLTRGIIVRDYVKKPYRMTGSQTDISERKKAENKLLHDALHDTLTGLPNRALFFDHLDLAVKRLSRDDKKNMFSVLFMDVDRFKIINDTMGHLIGDKLLIAVGKRLEECLRPGDTIARFGGDEFAVILEDIVNESDAIQLIERILDELSFPYIIDNNITENKIFNTVSIGVCMSDSDISDPENLLRNADIAMYYAKAAGRNCYKIFNDDMYKNVLTSMQLERDLRSALENNEFILHYQPLLSLKTKKIIGFEALVRWQHPDRGLIYPVEFIHLAESTGIIIDLGEWVLKNACKQLSIWQKKYPQDEPLTMSVNVSTKQFNNALVSLVKKTIEDTKIHPYTLKIEITETMLMESSDQIAPLLRKLKELKLELQIDDFGTGYSSLSYLHNFPIDALKIDKEFIKQLSEKDSKIEIVKTITALAENLNMYVVAEGVETEEQLMKLEMLYCRHIQGYLLSKPLNVNDVEKFIENSKHN